MELETIISLLTMIVTILMGLLAKKNEFISNNLIPLQNLIIGVLVSIGYYIVTKDFSASIIISSTAAGGIYDIPHNLMKLFNEEE